MTWADLESMNGSCPCVSQLTLATEAGKVNPYFKIQVIIFERNYVVFFRSFHNHMPLQHTYEHKNILIWTPTRTIHEHTYTLGHTQALYPGCTLVQAVVMVTTALMGNGHFWTAGNERPRNQSSPNFAQVITSVSLMCVQILVAIGCRGTSRHMREV